MKRRFTAPLAAIAIFGLMAAFAATAQAYPTRTTPCSGCHSTSTSVSVSATPVSNDGMNATYAVKVATASGLDGWAVFAGSTKLAYGTSATGSFTVPVGATYTVYGVINGGSSNSASISPAAPMPTPVPPMPSPDPTSTPSPDPTMTVPPMPSPDTSATPTTTPAPGPYTVRLHIDRGRHGGHRVKVTLTNRATGRKFAAYVNRRGYVTFRNVPAGAYRVAVYARHRHPKYRSILVPIVRR